MNQYVVIAQSPFHDTAVAVGPFRSLVALHDADLDLTAKGWNTETCELMSAADVEPVINDEGAGA